MPPADLNACDQLGIGLGRDQPLRLAAGQARGLGSAGGADERRGAVGAVEQFRIVEVEILAAVVGQGTVQQAADDVVGLGQPLVPLADAGPAFADDMLVEPFAGAETENEAVAAQHRQGRRGLRDDCRMVAHDRAGHCRHQPDMAGRLGGGAEHGPGERRMALLVEPGEEMVGNRREIEPGLFGAHRIAHQRGRPVFLGHQLVADFFKHIARPLHCARSPSSVRVNGGGRRAASSAGKRDADLQRRAGIPAFSRRFLLSTGPGGSVKTAA